MSMPATPLPAGGQLLACMNCGEQRTLPLDRSQLNELMSRQEGRLFCPGCPPQPLREGMEVFLLMPYHEGETLPEMRAKVVRVDKYGDVWEVGVEFAARS